MVCKSRLHSPPPPTRIKRDIYGLVFHEISVEKVEANPEILWRTCEVVSRCAEQAEAAPICEICWVGLREVTLPRLCDLDEVTNWTRI